MQQAASQWESVLIQISILGRRLLNQHWLIIRCRGVFYILEGELAIQICYSLTDAETFYCEIKVLPKLPSVVSCENSMAIHFMLLQLLHFSKMITRYDTLFYYHTKNDTEIDFVLKGGYKVSCLVQVSYDISDAKTRERELKALEEAARELQSETLLLITWGTDDMAEYKGHTIKIVSVRNWFLRMQSAIYTQHSYYKSESHRHTASGLMAFYSLFRFSVLCPS